MAYVTKAAIFCNGCGKKVDFGERLTTNFLRSTESVSLSTKYELGSLALQDWLEVDSEHHLCPKCAKTYKDKQKEMQRELNKIAGISEISFNL